MKQTLLDITQDILSSMDSDEVNSINDTVEATQVAKVIRRAYWDLISDLNLPEHHQLYQLEPSGDVSRPVLMFRPSNMEKITWVKYNRADAGENPWFELIRFLPVEDFINRMHNLQLSQSDVKTFELDTPGKNIPIYYKDDIAPQFYTVFEDRTLLFDSIDTSVESSLQSSRSLVYGQITPDFPLLDNHIPDLDGHQFPLLVNGAKAMAFGEVKQTQHAGAERIARRKMISTQKNKVSIPATSYGRPNYGRRK